MRACARLVHAGAILTVAPAPSVEVEVPRLLVVHEDEHLVVVDKPPGQLTQPSPLGSAGTLLDAVERHLRRGRRRPYVGLVHRLDREASGLVVFACTREAAASLSAAVRERTALRRYDVVVRGVPEVDEGRIELPLAHDARTNRASVDRGRGRPAATRWRVVERFSAATLTHIAAWLESGRTHQIRVHFAATLGPIVGDRRYGNPEVEQEERRLLLHASRLVVPHPATGTPMAFVSPLPEEFQDLQR